jgi:ribosomal protein L21E
MSTRTSLRRSRRAPKRISDYNVGDVVEVSLESSILS